MSPTPALSFVIFASPKSGTTWLQRLLSSHADVICTESRAFGDYYADNPLGQPHITLEKYVSILSHYYSPAVDGLRHSDKAFYEQLLFNTIDTLATTTMRATGKTLYGEKLTPYRQTAAHAVDMLHRYNPGLRFVNLVRDGRDVIVSGASQWLNLRLRQASGDDKAQWEQRITGRSIGDEDFESFLGYWIDATTAGLSAHDHFTHVLDIRYEDLLADPTGGVTELLEFIGADASAIAVATCVESASFKAMSGGRKHGDEDRHSFFRKGVAGDWQNWLTRAQLETFERRAGQLMKRAGYRDPATGLL
jgi:hypothetical protein